MTFLKMINNDSKMIHKPWNQIDHLVTRLSSFICLITVLY